METSEILSKLTLKEKISLCSGADFWHTKSLEKFGISSLMMCDGPHGLRCQKNVSDNLGVNESEPATCFPTAALSACSWDIDLLGKIGKAIADEAKALNVGLILGPGANIKRDPLCGRNFEYFSEDPYLSGTLAASFIKNAQSSGIGCSLKHFAFNNQEYKRFNSNSSVDERAMREIYLSSFETAVKEGKPDTVMCAYNKINGEHCSDSKWLLNDVLREEWGFDGLVVTDWGAMNDRIAAMKAGCDLNMPGGSDYMEKELLKAVSDGRLSEDDIDKCAGRVLKLITGKNKILKTAGTHKSDFNDHHLLAKEAAAFSAVLLKNENSILPLKANADIALIGLMAQKPRYQGAGSSHINPVKLSALIDYLPHCSFAPGYDENGNTDEALLSEAEKAAENADIAIIAAGLPDAYESEGFDRDSMQMPEGHLKLIERVCKVNSNVIVILCCGCVVECPFEEKVKAILYMGLSGQAGGEAMADIITGKANPCGKLAESWPVRYEDCITSSYYKGRKNPNYLESIYVGYRYYDKAKKELRWPFGFGLSYTTFEYSNINLRIYDPENNTYENHGSGQFSAAPSDFDNNLISVQLTVKNTGSVSGCEIVQLYAAPAQNGPYRPLKELKGYKKIFLNPNESKTISFALDRRSFSIWNRTWEIPNGEYEILIGSSSKDLPLSAKICICNEDLPAGDECSLDTKETITDSSDIDSDADNMSVHRSWYYDLRQIPPACDWLKIMHADENILEDKPLKRGNFTMDNTVLEMKSHSLIMNIMHFAVERTIAKSFGGKVDYSNSLFRMLMSSSVDSPLRSMIICSGMKSSIFKLLLKLANIHLPTGRKK